MAELLGVAASALQVASAAYISSKTLYEFIAGLRDAPKTFNELSEHLSDLTRILSSLEEQLENTEDTSLSSYQISILKEAKPTLLNCRKACDEFKEKLGKTFKRTMREGNEGGKTSFWDSVRLQFKEKTVADFRVRLEATKSSLTVVLDLASLKAITANNEAIHAIESRLKDAQKQISSEISLLSIRMDALLANFESLDLLDDEEERLAAETSQTLVLRPLTQQKEILEQCGRVVDAGEKQAVQLWPQWGHYYEQNHVLGDATLVMGNVGNVPTDSARHVAVGNRAEGNARMVIGNMDGENFARLMGLRPGQNFLDD